MERAGTKPFDRIRARTVRRHVDGKPFVVGPYDRTDDGVVPTVRTLVYRKLRDSPRFSSPSLAGANGLTVGTLVLSVRRGYCCR